MRNLYVTDTFCNHSAGTQLKTLIQPASSDCITVRASWLLVVFVVYCSWCHTSSELPLETIFWQREVPHSFISVMNDIFLTLCWNTVTLCICFWIHSKFDCVRSALQTIWSSTATGCCCHAGTITGVLNTCAARGAEVLVIKERQKKETSLLVLRHLHSRRVENSALCKMIQLDHADML